MSLLRDHQEASRDRRAYTLTSQVLWGISAALLVVVAGLIALTPMEFRNSPLPLNVMTFAVFGPVALVYTYLRFDVRIASLCDCVAVLSSFTIIGAAYTYVMTYLGAGMTLWDSRFLAADAALGLHWKSYLAWLNLHPLLGSALNSAYESILTQMACLIVLLVVLGQHRRLQSFILAAQLCIIVCGAAAAVMPALGPYPFFEINAAVDHPNIPLTTMNGHVAQVLQLRSAAPFLQLDSIEGIIVCPSFHMALAVLFAWAFWRIPYVRWVALMLNIAMAAGTPLSGGHYFIDIIAGAILAVTAIAVASALGRAIDRIASGQKASAMPAPRASPVAHSEA
jgi:hypothetical protein